MIEKPHRKRLLDKRERAIVGIIEHNCRTEVQTRLSRGNIRNSRLINKCLFINIVMKKYNYNNNNNKNNKK